MIKSYFTIAFRALWRNKLHSLINVGGLAIGVACCTLIALYLHEEWSFDRFHSKADRIFRVYGREDWGPNQQFFYTVTPFPMGPALEENLPEVERHVRINNMNMQVKAGAELFSEQATFAGPAFFEVFDFTLMAGDKSSALSNASAVVLSQRVATKYFGSENAIGKEILLKLNNNFEPYEVRAVVKDPPSHSSIQFDLLVSDLVYPQLFDQEVLTSGWFNINPETYVLLREGAEANAVEAKFPSLFRTLLGNENFEQSKYAPGLQPLLSIHLDTSYPVGIAAVSNPQYAYILAGTALLILVVACINFITLSVGRSIKRSREVGIRKVVGAQRYQLTFQFIGEALVITFISLLGGLILARLCLPAFNSMAGMQLTMQVAPFTIGLAVLLLVVIGFFAGSYPALVLSAFKPTAVLKGQLAGKGQKQFLRKLLVALQLALAIFLISGTLIMQKQLRYLQDKDLGFNKEQLAVVRVVVPQADGLVKRVQLGLEEAEKLKTAFAQIPNVKATCAASHDFGNGAWTKVGYTDDNKVYRNMRLQIADADYAGVMEMQFVAGRNFDKRNTADVRRSVLVNESLVKELGWDNPIGKRLPGQNFADHEVIGVLKDFHYSSLYSAVEPLVVVQDPSIILRGVENINIETSPLPKLFVRLLPGTLNATIEQLKTAWQQVTPDGQFDFSFVDDAVNRQYIADRNLASIIRIATLLAIFIGGLGLYGLASLAMQGKVKEISVRKVFGATQQSLWILLGREYFILVLISLAVSIPFTWLWMQQWLSTFAFRITMGWQVFSLSAIIALTVTLLTVAYEVIKTSRAQPAKTLKYE